MNVVANYVYDSWGKVISVKNASGTVITDSNNIGLINPFRYRSYYYDTETELYYLNSRYYNPEFGRFINADGIIGANEDMLGYNLYAYVSNNPINAVDPTGDFLISLIVLVTVTTIAGGAAATYIVSSAKQAANTGKVDYGKSVNDAGKGITIEGGAGFGGGASIGKIGGGYYNDATVKLDNGKIKVGSSINISGDLNILKLKGSKTTEYFHEYHDPIFFDTNANIKHSQIFPMHWDIANCPYTQVTKSTSIMGEKSKLGAEAEKNKIFIGFSGDFHPGGGFHWKIGYTFTR